MNMLIDVNTKCAYVMYSTNNVIGLPSSSRKAKSRSVKNVRGAKHNPWNAFIFGMFKVMTFVHVIVWLIDWCSTGGTKTVPSQMTHKYADIRKPGQIGFPKRATRDMLLSIGALTSALNPEELTYSILPKACGAFLNKPCVMKLWSFSFSSFEYTVTKCRIPGGPMRQIKIPNAIQR
mmetsp:Transcript_14777/g.30418  ORF Transcript_14777/g.30418 Transcript_14777/m.30418 type:complete len:177 (-) Transcript_14777:697-1227(-)